MASQELIVGIDIGGTNTVVGFIKNNSEIIFKDKMRTAEEAVFENFVEKLANVIKNFLKKHPEYDLKAVGIGAPNGNIHSGAIEYAPNLIWKGKLQLVELLKKEFDCPIKLTNDANAAALGEMKFGKAKDVKDYIFITLGTGLGSGFVSNGELIYGHDGMAGELGHVVVEKEGRQCGCGRKGCLETYVSATGIVRTAMKLMKNEITNSVLINNCSLDSKAIFDAAKKGDSLALEAFDFTANVLGQALANAVAITSPQVIYLFGGLAKSGDLLMKPLRKYLKNT